MRLYIYIFFLFFKDYKIATSFLKSKRDFRNALNFCNALFVFPYYHTGGAEKVHLKVAQAAIKAGLRK